MRIQAFVRCNELFCNELQKLFSGFSVPIAHIVSIYILKGGGVMAVFGTTLGLLTSSLLYTIFFVTESRKRSPPSKKIEPKKTLSDKENNIVNEFDVGNKNECAAIARKLFDCFVVTFKPREGHKRAIVLILMSTMCLNLLSGCNLIILLFLFLNNHWKNCIFLNA